jgi:PAS domain S-box-containing protein
LGSKLGQIDVHSFTSFEFKVSAAFAAAVLVVAGLATTAWKVANNASDAAQAEAHAHEVLDSLSRTRSDTLQIEFSTQNFRISGDPAQLVERDAAIAARETWLTGIRQLTAQNARQQERWGRLRAVVDERLVVSRRVEALRKTQGQAAATAFAASAPLQATRDRTYRLLREMEGLLQARLSERLQARQIMVVTGSLAAGALLVLLSVTYFLIRRQLRQTRISQRALADSEESLATTLHSIGDAVMATDTEARITRMNRVAEVLTGWTLAQARGRPIGEVFVIVNELTRAPAVVPVADVLASGEIRELANHTVLIAHDGSERPIADSAAPIRDTGGQLTGVVLVFRDVSAEHKAQQTIHEQNQLLELRVSERTRQLQESEQRYRTVFRTSPDAVAITQLADGRYLDVNDGFLRLFGWNRDEVLGRTSRELGMWHNWDERNALIQTVQRVGHCENFEASFVTKEGRLVAALVSATELSLGDTPCMLTVTRDITERKAAQDQIQQLAFSDSLTGLPNRRLFMDRFEQALTASFRHQRLGALVYVDLDDFKTLNETLGHDQGDLLLQQVALRLIRCIGGGDTGESRGRENSCRTQPALPFWQCRAPWHLQRRHHLVRRPTGGQR